MNEITQTIFMWGVAIIVLIGGCVMLAKWMIKRAEKEARLSAYDADIRAAAREKVAARDEADRRAREGWIADAKAGRGGHWARRPARASAAGAVMAGGGWSREDLKDPADLDFHSSTDIGFSVNPANGFPMVEGAMIDVGGHVYGSAD